MIKYQQLETIWDYEGLSVSEKFILVYLMIRADKFLTCWPSISKIAKDTGYCERQVSRCIKGLAERKHIRVIKKDGRNQYIILVQPKLPDFTGDIMSCTP